MGFLNRLRAFAVLALIAVSVSACGYNVIPILRLRLAEASGNRRGRLAQPRLGARQLVLGAVLP